MTQQKLVESRIEKVQGNFIHGVDVFEGGKCVQWMKLTEQAHKERFWFLYPFESIFKRCGWPEFDIRQLDAAIEVFDENVVRLVSYISTASHSNGRVDMVMNAILGQIAVLKKELALTDPYLVLHPIALMQLINAIVGSDRKFINSKFSLALEMLILGKTVREVEAEQSFWVDATVDVASIVSRAFIEHHDAIVAAKDKTRIGNWLVGQIMKANKGALDPNDVRACVFQQINI